MKMEKCSQYSTSDVVKLLQKKSQKNIATRYWSRNCLWSAAVAALALTILSGALLLINWPTIDVQQMKNTPYTPPVLSCYYSPVSVEDSGLQPDDIHPHLCTHINIAFAVIHNKSLILDQKLHAGIKRLVLMKNENPDLKILLSVGGGGNDKGFSDMVVDHASRKTFIRSIKNILRNYTLDGIDLDWEFPNVHDAETGSHKRERQHFSQLLREIRMEYIREKRNYLLTVAVAAPKTIVDTAYDVDQLNMYVDFVNLMTYDFHFFSRITPFTGFNSPLYGEESEQFLLGTLNINYTVHMYMDKGLARNKIVMGIPTYAHTFTLVNSASSRPGSPASGVGRVGAGGFADYPAVCAFSRLPGSIVTRDARAAVPYLHRGAEWISFDDPASVRGKAAFIRDNGLRGAMIYSLNADDYRGECADPDTSAPSTPRFPLVTTIKRTLVEGMGGDHTLSRAEYLNI